MKILILRIVDEEAIAGDESDEPTATESDEELAFPTNEAEGCNQGGDIGEDDEEINLEEILKELEDESAELKNLMKMIRRNRRT